MIAAAAGPGVAPTGAALQSYTHAEVAALFQVSRHTLYRKGHIMACRLPGTPVRYARHKIDAILRGETAPRRGVA